MKKSAEFVLELIPVRSKLYSQFSGINAAVDQLDANPLTFLQIDNISTNIKVGQGVKRGGTSHWATTGDVWGLGAYAKETASTKLPIYDVLIRHRRDGSTSYIETLDWSANTWGALTQGAVLTGDLGIGDVASFAQPSDLLCICAGMPAKLVSDTGNVNRLGGAAPTVAITLASSGTGLTGTFGYVYTWYDSSTGWESSPSSAAEITVADDQVDLSAIPINGATVSREGIDKKRIYRTIKTGEPPYKFLAEIAIATATYTDTTVDDDLGEIAPETGDHDPPPNPSYLVASHEGRLWIASGKQLWYSYPYDGSNYNLEYFSSDRVLNFPARITGLAVTRNSGLQVFCPVGFNIYEVEGRSEADFSQRTSWPALGTQYHSSVCVHDDYIAFWGPLGPTVISPDGEVREFGIAIENLLRDALHDEYNTSAFAWTVWSSDKKQFIFGFSATSSTGAGWVETDTGIVVPWIVTDTGAGVDWIENP